MKEGRDIEQNDWDPASSVGLTATEAAAARAVATRRCAAMINDPFAEHLVRAVGIGFFTRLAEQDIETDGSRFAMPGMVDWVAARTRFFDDFFTAIQAAGIRQSVILGAGLDSRAFRLRWAPGSTVYEIDQPGVVEFKSATMKQLNARPTVDHRTVATDLCGDWVSALRLNGFDPSLPTAWSAEGLLPYLPPVAQERLLEDVSELSPAGSWFAADTIADTSGLSDLIARSVKAWQQRSSDAAMDISELITRCRAPDAARQLRRRDWASMSFAASDLLAGYGLPEVTDEDNPCRHVRFVTALRGRTEMDHLSADI